MNNLQVEKGHKGFKSVPKELQLVKRVSAYITESEDVKFKEYLKQHDITGPKLIRSLIKGLKG
tara:strand:- start:63 stop:251 length:189 start_codon:yes stop_codon:yes gene_type:complete